MFDHLLESSHRDDSNKWSNIGFGQEKTELGSIEVNFTHLIWYSVFASHALFPFLWLHLCLFLAEIYSKYQQFDMYQDIQPNKIVISSSFKAVHTQVMLFVQ